MSQISSSAIIEHYSPASKEHLNELVGSGSAQTSHTTYPRACSKHAHTRIRLTTLALMYASF